MHEDVGHPQRRKSLTNGPAPRTSNAKSKATLDGLTNLKLNDHDFNNKALTLLPWSSKVGSKNEELHRAYIELQKISSAVHEEAQKQFVQLQAAETRINAMQKEGQNCVQQND